MRLDDVIRLGAKALTERKIRATLTIIGIAIGPMVLLMIGSILTGYSEYIISSITGLGQNIIVVTPRPGYRLTHDDVNYISSIPNVVSVEPFYSTTGEVTIHGERRSVYIYGVNPEFILKAITNLKVIEGYAPAPTDHGKALAGYSIVYEGDGSRNYELGDVLSVTTYVVRERGRVEVRRLNVVVAGVLDKFGGAVFLNPDESLFVPLETLERALGVREWSGILVLVSSPDVVDAVSREIARTYGNNVNVISFVAIARTVSDVVAAVDFVTFAATTSAFAVAVAGVAASMITSVMERTREIGVLKAIGFNDKQVLLLILFEGVIMSLIGYAIGVALGVTGSIVIAESGASLRIGEIWEIHAGPKFTAELFARSAAMTLSVGVLGALFPAYKAMKIPPAVALKYE
ncbi:MAG: ABC transporter permease [Desulfurococcaceae archaeon]